MASRLKHKMYFTPRMYAFLAAVLLAMTLLGYLALRAINQEVPLVSAESADTVGDVAIVYQQKNQTLLLQLPYTFGGLPIAGSIKLRHPADQTLDLQFAFKPRRNMRQQVEVAKLKKGRWKVGVLFTAGDETYYSEKAIHIK